MRKDGAAGIGWARDSNPEQNCGRRAALEGALDAEIERASWSRPGRRSWARRVKGSNHKGPAVGDGHDESASREGGEALFAPGAFVDADFRHAGGPARARRRRADEDAAALGESPGTPPLTVAEGPSTTRARCRGRASAGRSVRLSRTSSRRLNVDADQPRPALIESGTKGLRLRITRLGLDAGGGDELSDSMAPSATRPVPPRLYRW